MAKVSKINIIKEEGKAKFKDFFNFNFKNKRKQNKKQYKTIYFNYS